MELVDDSPGNVIPPTFGARLRAARLSRNVTLDAVAAHTKLNRVFFQDLERNDLSKWPSNQFYRESYLRAYCEAVGLDARDVIEGYRREVVAAPAQAAAAPARPRRLTPVTIPIILAVTFVVFYTLARWLAPSVQKPAVSLDTIEKPAMAVEAPAAEPPAPAAAASEPSAQTTAPEPTVPSAAAPVAPAPRAATEESPAQADVAPPAPEHVEGRLVITSSPAGATVLVNGINRGTSPVEVQYLPAGTHSVRFIYPGLTSVTKRVTITAERRTVQVSATLE